ARERRFRSPAHLGGTCGAAEAFSLRHLGGGDESEAVVGDQRDEELAESEPALFERRMDRFERRRLLGLVEATEGVAVELLGDALADALVVLEDRGERPGISERLAVELAGSVDRLAVVERAILPDRVEVLEEVPRWVEQVVTPCACRVRPV